MNILRNRSSICYNIVFTAALLPKSFAYYNSNVPLLAGSRRNFEMSATTSDGDKNLVVDPFCFRQFKEHTDGTYTGTVFDMNMEEFEAKVNEQYDANNLVDGYAPFCKHIFIPNFTSAVVNVLKIDDTNEQYLRSKYEARNDKELPVLQRFFSKELLKDIELPKAKYLDLILYSRDQIRNENSARGDGSNLPEAAPWGIVSIKAQDISTELPMNPITVMRNALGKEQGGSGIPLVRSNYMEAVNYWKDHGVVS